MPDHSAKRPGTLFLIVLGTISFAAPLTLHAFFPALTSAKQGLSTDAETIQLTVSIPLLVMGIFTLVYGSMSDHHGRRPLLLGGLALFAIGGVAAALADTIWLLIIARAVQAAGGACGIVLARAIAKDVFGEDGLVKAIAYITMAFSLAPMAALPISGFLVDMAGWRSVLVFSATMGLIMLVVVFFVIHETHHPDKSKKRERSYLGSYIHLFRDIRFTAFQIQNGASSGTFFAMATAAGFLMMEYLGRSSAEYGLYFPLFPVGYLAGNFVASRFAGRVGEETMVLVASLIQGTAMVGMSGALLTDNISPLTIFLPGIVTTFSFGMAVSNSQSAAMRIAGPLAGTAAGVGAALQLLAGGLFTQLLGALSDGTTLPIVITLGCSSVVAMFGGIVAFISVRSMAKRPLVQKGSDG